MKPKASAVLAALAILVQVVTIALTKSAFGAKPLSKANRRATRSARLRSSVQGRWTAERTCLARHLRPSGTNHGRPTTRASIRLRATPK
jgi:hypothetical protein